MQNLLLYSTLGCHLCELAKEHISPLLSDYQLHLLDIDIANDDVLMQRYAITIPVIKLEGGCEELAWPFEQGDVRQWLSAQIGKPL